MKNYSQAIQLVELSTLDAEQILSIEKENIRFLIVVKDNHIHVLEDRCGHFGISLKNGTVEHGYIRCPAHGAKFDLQSGELRNDLFEDCEPINVFLWQKKNGWLEVLI